MEAKRPSEDLASDKQPKQARTDPRRPEERAYRLRYLKHGTPKRTNDEVHSTILMNPYVCFVFRIFAHPFILQPNQNIS
jgi:hypothetical protein